MSPRWALGRSSINDGGNPFPAWPPDRRTSLQNRMTWSLVPGWSAIATFPAVLSWCHLMARAAAVMAEPSASADTWLSQKGRDRKDDQHDDAVYVLSTC